MSSARVDPPIFRLFFRVLRGTFASFAYGSPLCDVGHNGGL
jgi:hypothetical protein